MYTEIKLPFMFNLLYGEPLVFHHLKGGTTCLGNLKIPDFVITLIFAIIKAISVYYVYNNSYFKNVNTFYHTTMFPRNKNQIMTNGPADTIL